MKMQLVLQLLPLSVATLAASGLAHASTTYASLIAINSNGTAYVEELTIGGTCSTILGPYNLAPYGAAGYPPEYAADLDFDGLTDLISYSSQGISVWYGQSGAGGQTMWGPAMSVYSGNLSVDYFRIGDLNGDHHQDLIAWHYDHIDVLFGTSGRGVFAAPSRFWTGAFEGNVANVVADWDNDGKQDLFAWNSDSIYFLHSAGTYADIEDATGECVPFYGSVTNVSTNVWTPAAPSATGLWDEVIAWKTDSIYGTYNWYAPGGCDPAGPYEMSSGAFYGTRANLVVDVDLNGYNDVVAQNDSSAYVELWGGRGGDGFGPSTLWCANGAFYGSYANVAGYTSR